jgi:hypothetical protein
MGDGARDALRGYIRGGMPAGGGTSETRPRTETRHHFFCPCCGRVGNEWLSVKGHHRDVHHERLRDDRWAECRIFPPLVVERAPFLKQGASYRAPGAPDDCSDGVFTALMVRDGAWEIRGVDDAVVEEVSAPDTREGRRAVAAAVQEVAGRWGPVAAARRAI